MEHRTNGQANLLALIFFVAQFGIYFLLEHLLNPQSVLGMIVLMTAISLPLYALALYITTRQDKRVERIEKEWLEDRCGCFNDGVQEGRMLADKELLQELRQLSFSSNAMDYIKWVDAKIKELEQQGKSEEI